MTRRTALVKKARNLDLLTASASDIQPRSDLTFRVFDNLTVQGNDAYQSLLNGCLVRNCTFEGVRFARCDLEQIQFQKSIFRNVSFENVELNSARINGCRFEECKFDDALVSDSTLDSCSFQNCSFQKAVLQRSVFETCRIAETSMRGASVQLNSFRKTNFEKTSLGDCTFLNQLMIDCQFKDVRMNVESLGSVFGISEQTLASLDLVHLGQTVVGTSLTGDLLSLLEEDYERRRWLFMREMLRLSFQRTPPVFGLNACLEALLWPATFGAPLKAGDVVFLEMVTLELFRRKELPALSVLSFPDRIKRFQTEHANEQPELQRLANRARGLLVEMLPNLKGSIENLGPKEKYKRVAAKLIFDTKPEFDVLSLMDDLAVISGLQKTGKTLFLGERAGSYLLFVKTSLTALAGLQVALWLINGCVAQLIELKARVKIVSQKSLPKVIRDRVLLPDQNVPKWMAVVVQNLFSKFASDSEQLRQVATDLGSKNLKQIEIEAPKSLR